jgi:predicted Zn-dependent protease
LAVVTIIVALGGCASALADTGRPPSDARLPSDEDKLREEAGKESRRLAGGPRAYDDPALAAYLTTIARRLAPGDAPAVTVLVLREPLPGAFALPDGTIAVHTGLLARVENEAQIAAVLGREVAHVVARHAAARGAPAAADGFPPTPPLFVGADVPLARAADLDGQGRQRERDADRAAIDAMTRAGYDPREFARVFERLGADETADAAGPFYLGSRRGRTDRLDSARDLLEPRAGTPPADGAARDAEEFDRRLPPVLRDNAVLAARAGRFALARAQIDRALAVAPGDARALVAEGEILRLEAQRRPADAAALTARARAAYERAATLDPALAEPHRQLGVLYYQMGARGQARAAWQRYLDLSPDAADAPRIREYLSGLPAR